MPGTRITRQAFTRAMQAFAPFEDRPVIAIALSGGADSLALALLLHDWCKEQQGRLVALTVDHGLRPESSAEADQVGSQMTRLGIEWHKLAWQDGPAHKNRNGMQHQARKARYALLTGFCQDHNILHLCTGHHADDQAETIAMQENRQMPAPAGMPAAWFGLPGHCPDIRLLRPLLPFSRTDTEATCHAARQAYVHDPSNDNPAYERVAVRQSDHKITATSGNITAVDLTDWHLSAAGFAKLSIDTLPALSVNGLRYILRHCAARDYAPGFAQTRAALAGLQSGKDQVLHNCRLVLRRKCLWVFQEYQAPLRGYRFPDAVTIDRLGEQGRLSLPALLPDWMAGLPPVLINSLPAQWQLNRPVALPGFDALPGLPIQTDNTPVQAYFRPLYPASGMIRI